jgi:hypothetical protein
VAARKASTVNDAVSGPALPAARETEACSCRSSTSRRGLASSSSRSSRISTGQGALVEMRTPIRRMPPASSAARVSVLFSSSRLRAAKSRSRACRAAPARASVLPSVSATAGPRAAASSDRTRSSGWDAATASMRRATAPRFSTACRRSACHASSGSAMRTQRIAAITKVMPRASALPFRPVGQASGVVTIPVKAPPRGGGRTAPRGRCPCG